MTNEMLRSSLDPACVRLTLRAGTRDDAIRELVGVIHAKHRLKNPDEVLSVIMERERKMSTSLENGIAVPHGKTDVVDRVLVAVGIKQSGIDFQSADGLPSKIIILMVSPLSTTGPHVRCLAEIARLLQSESNRKKVIEANVSDIAAMGGLPKYALISLGLPKKCPGKFLDGFYRGANKLARQFKTNIVGGDLSSSPQIVVDVSVLGTVKKKKLVLRSGAKPGDIIFVPESIF